MSQSNRSKFSFADIISFVAALAFFFICFLSMYFKKMGDIATSVKKLAIFSIVLFVLAFLLKIWKMTSRKFHFFAWMQIITLVMFVVAAYLFLPAFSHFFTVLENRKEIIIKTHENFDHIENMFSDYKTYSNDRIDTFKRNLDAAIAGKSANLSNYHEWGLDETSGVTDEKQKETLVDMLRTNLLESGFSATDTIARQWLSESKNKVTSWNRPFEFINVINTVEQQGNKWKNELIRYSEFKCKNEKTEPFNYNISFGNITALFIQTGSPTPIAIVAIVIICFAMIFSWMIADKHPRNNIPFLKLLFWNKMGNEPDNEL